MEKEKTIKIDPNINNNKKEQRKKFNEREREKNKRSILKKE